MTRQFPALFHQHVLRYIAQHRLLATLNVLAVALGVAVFLAIQIANRSAAASFEAGIDIVAGRADLEVRGRIDDMLFPLIRQTPGVAAATPAVDLTVTLPAFPGEYLQLVGLDPFTDGPFRTFTAAEEDGSQQGMESWLRRPDSLWLSAGFARKHGIIAGQRLMIVLNGRAKELTVDRLVTFPDSPPGDANRYAFLDIGWAQELSGNQGQLDRVSIRLAPGASPDAVTAALRAALPATLETASPAGRNRQISKMLSAFRLNLTAMSLVSMLVGMFLIFNTISASVVRRKPATGVLRALGATRAEISALFLGEASIYALAGVAIGIAGGILLASGMIGAVSKTISSLYMLTRVESILVAPGQILAAVALGAGSVLVAAWAPAREAARVDPVEALAPDVQETGLTAAAQPPAWLPAAILAGAGGAGWIAVATGPPVLGFVSAFLALSGFAFLAPPGIRLASRAAAAFLGWFSGPVVLELAAMNFRRALRRNAVNVAALTAALAMVAGLSTMIHSFRLTVQTWIGQVMTADLFVAPSTNAVAGLTSFVPPEAVQSLEHDPRVAKIDTYREVTLPFRGQEAALAVVLGDRDKELRFLGGRDGEKRAAFFEPGNVLVTESFSRRFGIKTGDDLALPTPAGMRTFAVAGIYYDYTSDSGVILMTRKNFDAHWNDPGVHSVAVCLRDPSQLAQVESEFLKRFGGDGGFVTYSNRLLRQRVLEIFDQTFSVTYILRAIAIVVAVIGIFLTSSTLVTERVREIGILRSLGASGAQIRALVLGESVLTGLIACILGLAAGAALAIILTFVINKAFFGWTIGLEFPWGWLASLPLWIIPVCLAAAWLPAIRAAAIDISSAIRSE